MAKRIILCIEPQLIPNLSELSIKLAQLAGFQPETSFMVGAAEPIPGLNCPIGGGKSMFSISGTGEALLAGDFQGGGGEM